MASVQFADRSAASPLNASSQYQSRNVSSGRGILSEMESIKTHARVAGLPVEVTLGVNNSEH